MRRTGPLTVHDLVEIIRIRNVGRLHHLLDNGRRLLCPNFLPLCVPGRVGSGSITPGRAGPNPGADTSRAFLGIPPIRPAEQEFSGIANGSYIRATRGNNSRFIHSRI
jgi:hypothetical protein